jgi:succinate dehydrogenase / fumarate reductase cytochrome b subunit
MLRRVHSLTGVLVLGPYLIFHLWENWAALSGAGSWADRHRWIEVHLETQVQLLFAIALAAHVLTCLGRRTGSGEQLLESTGLRRLQRITGIAVLLFMAYHVYHAGLPRSGGYLAARGGYDVLWSDLGRPLPLVAYVAGVTLVFFHLAHGLSRAPVGWGLVTSATAVQRTRLVAGTFGFLLWGLALHLLGYFAAGQGLFG